MNYNFDTLIDRFGTSCVKYDMFEEKGLAADTLPLWVADMDFEAPPAVRNRLKEIAEQNVYGYTYASDGYKETVLSWFDRRFNWRPDVDSMFQTPGVVFGITVSLLAYTNEGDKVLIQEPVYHPFRNTIQTNKREVVSNPLKLINGRYEIDFDLFEKQIKDEDVKMFVLCSPHNPVGRVWTTDELQQMGDICLKHEVVIVSDEIHADFVFPGHKHHMFTSVDPRFKEITVSCTAASKSFNLAGLDCSNIFVENESMREAFSSVMSQVHISGANMMGLAATEAAYQDGEAWLDQLLVYLAQNVATVRGFLKAQLPEVKLIEPDGTYLLWLDFRELGLTQDELNTLLLQEAKVWLNDGAIFGAGGEGFMRMNVACQRSIVQEALERITKVIR